MLLLWEMGGFRVLKNPEMDGLDVAFGWGRWVTFLVPVASLGEA